eukprot:1732133-Rhodomonas_salina.2
MPRGKKKKLTLQGKNGGNMGWARHSWQRCTASKSAARASQVRPPHDALDSARAALTEQTPQPDSPPPAALATRAPPLRSSAPVLRGEGRCLSSGYRAMAVVENSHCIITGSREPWLIRH